MEEIDIIELLKRVKEGNAPKKIMIGGKKYEYDDTWEEIGDIYDGDYGHFLYKEEITLDTKIKILDKPIIEELPEDIDFIATVKDDQMKAEQIGENRKKINEIIRYINKESEEQ